MANKTCWDCDRSDVPLVNTTTCPACWNAMVAEADAAYDPDAEAEHEAYARFGRYGGRVEMDR